MNIDNILGKIIRPGDTVFDVGGHIGNVAWYMSRCAGPMGRVYSFEPQPVSFQALKKKAERHPNISAINCAVSNSTSPVILYFAVTEAKSQASTIIEKYGTPERLGNDIRSTEVSAITLDGFADAQGLQPSVIKIDTEGAESKVLEGGARLLISMPTIIIELGLDDQHMPAHIGELRARGYELFFIEMHRFVSTPPTWDQTVSTETPALQDCLISFDDVEVERLAPLTSNVLAIAPKNLSQLKGLKIIPLSEASQQLTDPKRSLGAVFKAIVRRWLITKDVEERFPRLIAMLRAIGRKI